MNITGVPNHTIQYDLDMFESISWPTWCSARSTSALRRKGQPVSLVHGEHSLVTYEFDCFNVVSGEAFPPMNPSPHC